MLPCVYAWTPISPTSMILIRALAIGLLDHSQPLMLTRMIVLPTVRRKPDLTSCLSLQQRVALP